MCTLGAKRRWRVFAAFIVFGYVRFLRGSLSRFLIFDLEDMKTLCCARPAPHGTRQRAFPWPGWFRSVLLYVVLLRGHKSVHQWLDRSASLARYTSMGIPLARPVLISINMLSLSRAFVAISPFITGWTAMPASSGTRQ